MPVTIQPAVKTDARVRSDVLSEIAWDPFVRDVPVNVAVAQGVVTLTGQAQSMAKHLALVDAVHRVQGVLDVVDEMTIAPAATAMKTDDEIARAVREALQWDAFLPDERISTTVSAGNVTLRGTVPTWSSRMDAERCVQRLTGVRSVTNRIAVEPASADPDAIKMQIERALERRAEREARRITVSVRDGTVTLSGSVHSWSDRSAVERLVGNSPGVRTVDDRLVVDPYA
ncbi:MAG: BON domain-containing protein [Actinobacteria bacterium]|nr:BON domain-containing protein [Actinomycetota bacterium]